MKRRLLSILIITIILIHFANAQIKVKLQEPQPNRLGTTELWNATLTNSSRTTYSITLEGTLDEKNEGRIATINTRSIKLPPGTTTITNQEILRKGAIRFQSGVKGRAMSKSGHALDGYYSLCLIVKDNARKELASDCITQHVRITPPVLLSPSDGAKISGEQPTFSWQPPSPGFKDVKYTLKIVSVQENQTPVEAMQKNGVWYAIANIKAITFSYPPTAKKLEKGRQYAWQISVLNNRQILNKSEIRRFITTQEGPKRFCDENDVIWSDQYTSLTGWNVFQTSNPGIATCPAHTASGTITINNGQCVFNNAEDGCDIRVCRNLGVTLPNTWTADFEYQYTAIGNGNLRVGHDIFALTAGNLNPMNNNQGNLCNLSNQDGVMVCHMNNSITPTNIGLFITVKQGAAFQSSPTWIAINQSVLYYIRFERIGQNKFILCVFTDPDRTQLVQNGIICFESAYNPSNLRFIQHSNTPQGFFQRQLTATIDNTCIRSTVLGNYDQLKASIELKDIYCMNEAINADGSGSEQENQHAWSLQETDNMGNAIGLEVIQNLVNQPADQMNINNFAQLHNVTLKCPAYYRIKLKVASTCGEEETSKIIKIVCPPGADAGPDRYICCRNISEITLGGSLAYPVGHQIQFQWSSYPPGFYSTEYHPVITPSYVGPINYILTVTDQYGCSSGDTAIIWVDKPFHLDPITTAVSAFTTCCEPKVVLVPNIVEDSCPSQMAGNGRGPRVQYLWSTGETTPSIRVNPRLGSTYSVTVSNSCASHTQQITPTMDGVFTAYGEFPQIIYPNAFTPNGDGVNDYFEILEYGPNAPLKGVGPAYNACEYQLDILDRWGGWHTVASGTTNTGFKNGEIKWDGRINGTLVENDYYQWMLTLKNCTYLDGKNNLYRYALKCTETKWSFWCFCYQCSKWEYQSFYATVDKVWVGE